MFVLLIILFDNLNIHSLHRSSNHLTISHFQMSHHRESCIAYFISLTHCQRENAIELLEKTKWKLDESLNLFFEHDYNHEKYDIHSKRIDAPYQEYENKTNARAFDLVPLLSRSLPKTIIIPTMIEFQR